jgi:hypothetical protein
VLPGTKSHGVKVHFAKSLGEINNQGQQSKQASRHFVENLLARSLPVKLARLRIWIHHLIEELANRLLKRPVILRVPDKHPPPPAQYTPSHTTHLGVVWTVEALSEVRRLPIRHLAESSDQATCDHALLPADYADLKPGVLRPLEYLVPVEAVESLGRVLARGLAIDQHGPPAGMEVGET